MITQQTLDGLSLLVSHGAESAGLTLSRWLHRKVRIPVSSVELVRLDEIPEETGESGDTTVTMASRVSGDLPGNIAIQLSLPDAIALVTCLGSSPPVHGTANVLGDMEISMLQETANILFSSLMNSLANHLGLMAVPRSPGVIVDIGTAAWNSLLMESAEASDEAVVVTARLGCIGSGPTIRLVFIPSPQALMGLSHGVDHAQH